MNILIIDDGLLPFDKSKAKAFGKTELLRLEHENAALIRELSAAFAARAQNVLFISAAEDGFAAPGHFEYSGEGGVLSLTASVEAKGGKNRFPFLKYTSFCRLLRQSAAVLSGLFKPDAVIFASFTPFCAAAAEQIAAASGAVLIAAVPCSFSEAFRRLCGGFFCAPMLSVLKRRSAAALRRAAVFGFYPKLLQSYSGGRLVAPPPAFLDKKPSEEAVFVHDSIAALSGGEVFTVCYCGRLSSGLSLAALVSAAKGFGKRFLLAIVGNGDYKAELRRAARENGVNDICFYDGVPERDIPFVLSAADAVFIAESSIIKGSANEYGDFLRAFSAAKPTVAAVRENAAFIKDCGGAVAVSPDDGESIAKAFSAIAAADGETRRLLGKACGEFAAKHSFNAFAEGFLSAVDTLVKSKEKQQ